jgi:hypothetical protein
MDKGLGFKIIVNFNLKYIKLKIYDLKVKIR